MQPDHGSNGSIRFIGHVEPAENGFKITLGPAFIDGLVGLGDFSHAIVLWWADQADSAALRNQLIYTKPYVNNPDDVGVFGSRSPSRPNPIGLSVIALQNVDLQAGEITTPYIDTTPGTPVLDLKPYFPASDRVRDFTTPDWCSHWPSCYEASADFDWEREFE